MMEAVRLWQICAWTATPDRAWRELAKSSMRHTRSMDAPGYHLWTRQMREIEVAAEPEMAGTDAPG